MRVKWALLCVATATVIFVALNHDENNSIHGAPQLTHQSGQASSVNSDLETGNSAESSGVQVAASGYELTTAIAKEAISSKEQGFFEALKSNPNCADCDAIFTQMREELISADDPDKIKLLATAMAQSGRANLVADLVAQYKGAGQDAMKQSLIADALEIVSGNQEVSEVLAPLVSPDEAEELREAAVSGLSGLSDRVAAEALLRYARDVGDGKGGYEAASGLGEFIPNEESLPLLQRVASDGSPESPLAVKALFNGGAESTRIAMDAILATSDEVEQKRLLEGAQSHVLIEPYTLDYLRSVINSGKSLTPTVKGFIEEILAHDARD